MTRKEKALFRYAIVSNDMQNRFKFEKSFFELDSYDLAKLDKYAEIFGIKPDNQGRSRARVLWYQLVRIDSNLPF